ncbi:helix-turn-helix domain-containing protein [Gilliamella sp. ESL0443]|uniref:helix-turn-helix domain-containing protein n=1 Tax=Gilliamella sp. ESL0443 TaxID=2704655 RepID=UPI001C6A23FB|nr:helix-turn-helix domain-containing protein [Gilliamella sp. ESL0443]QYN42379.1 helix-turn-helix domain-containing protein [Gilliamella sp. ESL0443]
MERCLRLYKQDYFISKMNTVTVEKRDHQHPFPLHDHDFYEIVIVCSGNGLHYWNDYIYPITSGDILYINPNDVHGYESVNDLKLDNILYLRESLFLLSTIESYLPKVTAKHNERSWRIQPSYLKLLSPLIEKLAIESKKNNLASVHLSEALFLQLVILLDRIKQAPKVTEPTATHQLDLLFTALHNSIATPFNVDVFCKENHIASRSLSRLFKSQTGMTISGYLQKRRLCDAMSLLRNTNYSISMIAAECGYDDSNYFSSVFKKQTNQTPSEYRAKFNDKKC